MRFIHAADLHLDSQLRGLEEYPGAPVERLRGATREAIGNLVSLCIDESVAFLVIAGDLFDYDWKDFQTALFVVQQFQRLDRAGIPVYLIFGNHDAREEMSRKVPWPKNVAVFDHKRPETKILAEYGIALHGMSFPKREVTKNLVPDYPEPLAGMFNIGLLHTNANSSPNHDSYAPCRVEELVAKGYDYWALGHVHTFEVLHERPHVVYSGNIQGRNIRETGTKGCVLVTVDDREVTDIEFRETDVLRWHRAVVSLEEADRTEEMLDRVRAALRNVVDAAEGLLTAVRLEIEGRCAAHRDLVRDADRQQATTDLRALAGEFGDDVWIEKIKFRTQSPLNLEELRQGQDLVGELLREMDVVANDAARLGELAELLKPLSTKVAGELADQTGGESIDFNDPELLAGWLREAEAVLLSHLVEEPA